MPPYLPHTSGVLALQKLTEQGRRRINDLAQRYGVSTDAVMVLLQALINGNGTMAQFNHPELGGSGQWLQGGMTMVGDMFNHGLKAKVDGLCTELSQILGQQPFVPFPLSGQSQMPGGQQQQQQGGYGSPGMVGGGPAVSLFVPATPGSSGNWWPADLGFPSGTGSQNNIRYAYFAYARRLAVEINGHVTVYDTLDHQIGGVSQQQGAGASLTFTSQYGTVPVASLPVVSIDGVAQKAPAQTATPVEPEPYRAESPQEADIFAKIERLAELERKGILSQEEFTAKKSELLGRL
ncbi:MAG: SHOCT domain-containing protein [Planctomycetaceae bacterium]|nr:SHOCT domain-containing protein [Planctomycetaceae bacterium]